MASTMRRASVLRRALLSAPPSSVPAVRRATAPPRPFYSQTSGAAGDQPPKSALEKLDLLFEGLMRKGVCSMDQDMAQEIVTSIQHARREIIQEDLRNSCMVAFVLTAGGAIGYMIRKTSQSK